MWGGGQGCPQSYKCRFLKNTQWIRKRKGGESYVLQEGGILRGQTDRSSSRDPPTGKSHREGSTSQHAFSKQCLLPSTHTPGAEFQVLNLDNTAGILAVLLHIWDFRQLSVKNICKEYSLYFSHDRNENEYLQVGLPSGSVAKHTPASARDAGSFPVWGRPLGGRHGSPLQCSCLRILWTEEPGGLQPTGSQRVRHHWTTIYFVVFLFYIFYVLMFALVSKSCLTFLQPHRLWPSRLFCPWDFPGKNTGVGCHSLLRGSSQSRDRIETQSWVSCIGRWVLYHWVTRASPIYVRVFIFYTFHMY